MVTESSDLTAARPRSSWSRRLALGTGLRIGALVAIATGVSATTGCSSEPPAPDPLEALAASARSDATLATGVASAHGSIRAEAEQVAQARREHAAALQREVDRANPPDPEAHRPATPPSPRVPGNASQAKAALRQQLSAAQSHAAHLVPSAANHRAGLLGSVSASCAGLMELIT